MIFKQNLAAILADTGQATGKKTKLVIVKDLILVPVLGNFGILLLWLVVALTNHESKSSPPGTLVANLD